jgi:hypothetical protein
METIGTDSPDVTNRVSSTSGSRSFEGIYVYQHQGVKTSSILAFVCFAAKLIAKEQTVDGVATKVTKYVGPLRRKPDVKMDRIQKFCDGSEAAKLSQAEWILNEVEKYLNRTYWIGGVLNPDWSSVRLCWATLAFAGRKKDQILMGKILSDEISCPLCAGHELASIVKYDDGRIVTKDLTKLDNCIVEDRYYYLYPRVTQWSLEHDYITLRHEEFVHESQIMGHYHAHVYPDAFTPHRLLTYENIKVNRLEFEILQEVDKVLSGMQTQLAKRRILKLSRLVPFPLPLSKVKTVISPEVWNALVNAQYFLCTMTLPLMARYDLHEMMNTKRYVPEFADALSEDVVIIDTSFSHVRKDIKFYKIVQDVSLAD